MKNIVDYGNITFNNIYGKFRLTDKYFEDTEAKYGYYAYMAQEWQDLMKFDHLFVQTCDSSCNYWSHYVYARGHKGKRYGYVIECNTKTRLLSRIVIRDLPHYKGSEERRKKIIKDVRKKVGYFISIMIHHGYMERIGE